MAQTNPLRLRMIEDLAIRNLSPATQRSYVHQVAKFSQFLDDRPTGWDTKKCAPIRPIWWTGRSLGAP